MTVISKLPSVILEINKELLFSLFSTHPHFLKTFLEFISDHASIQTLLSTVDKWKR